MSMTESFLLLHDASDLLKVLGLSMAPSTLRWHADKKDLPCQRTSCGTRLFLRRDLEAFAKTQLTKKDREQLEKRREEDLHDAMRDALRKPISFGDLANADGEDDLELRYQRQLAKNRGIRLMDRLEKKGGAR